MVFPRRLADATAAVLVMALAGVGCRSAGETPPDRPLDLVVPLPPDVAATLAAATVRHLLVGADPAPHERAVPLSLVGTNRFRIECCGDGRGRWALGGTHRARICAADEAEATALRQLLPDECPSPHAYGAAVRLQLDVVPASDGARILGTVPGALVLSLVPALERTFELASSCAAIGCGLEEPNLAAFRQRALLHAAASQRSPGDTRALLQRAARLPDAPYEVHAQLATLYAAGGEPERARASLSRALLAARDPAQRAQLARQQLQFGDPAQPLSQLQSSARRELRRGDFAAAASLLHTAQRSGLAPEQAYRLLQRVHEQGGDPLGARAAQLLAREHDPLPNWPEALQMLRQQLAGWSREVGDNVGPWVQASLRRARAHPAAAMLAAPFR